MNIIRVVVSILLVGAGAVHAAEYSSIRQYVYPVVVSTTGSTPSKNEIVIGSGSAVVIQAGYMLTAAHVIPATAADRVYIVRGDQYLRAIPIKIDRNADLALLSVAVTCPCASIAGPERIEIDTPIFSVGFPMYMMYGLQLLTQGHLQGGFMNNMVSTTVTAPGGSGGGLFTKLETQYKLIGITVAIASSPIGPRVMNMEQEHNWVSFSVPSATIRTFLRGTPVKLE